MLGQYQRFLLRKEWGITLNLRISIFRKLSLFMVDIPHSYFTEWKNAICIENSLLISEQFTFKMPLICATLNRRLACILNKLQPPTCCKLHFQLPYELSN